MSGVTPIGDYDDGTIYGDQQKAIVQQVIDDQAEYDRQFRQHHSELLEQTSAMRAGMMQKIKGGPQITPEIQQIIDVLMAQPLLVPLVQKLIKHKIAAIAEAVQGVLAE